MEIFSAMATGTASSSVTGKFNQQTKGNRQEEKRHSSIFELSPELLDSCRLLPFPTQSLNDVFHNKDLNGDKSDNDTSSSNDSKITSAGAMGMQRWTCITCKGEFESLLEQRSHFKSDFHRLNIKLSVAGKLTINEDDFDETTLPEDFDVSSISGSEDEDEKETGLNVDGHGGLRKSVNNRLFIQLQTGEILSIWKSFLLDDSETVVFGNSNTSFVNDGGCHYTENEVIEKVKHVSREPRNGTQLRVVLLATGGHFAGCVLDGTSVVAHKTFHRYVIRGKAGKRQSTKDASGKIAHSAGSALRRHNELGLKKDIQELLASWKPYFAVSSCIFLHAPSINRQLFFDGDKSLFFHNPHAIRNIPLTVRRPTFKEARRVYTLMSQVSSEVDEETNLSTTASIKKHLSSENIVDNGHTDQHRSSEVGKQGYKTNDISVEASKSENVHISSDSESERVNTVLSTPLHEAAKSGDSQKVLNFLDNGLDPCVKDERGRTPYMLADDKEVRNTFRRFMASHPQKWDWNAAKVPSALTREMEESQTAKQAEKDAKRKAKAKELKKLRKAREKKAQAEATQSKNAAPVSSDTGQIRPRSSATLSKEEELKMEREKRAAAAERRMAAAAGLKAQGTGGVTASSSESIVAGAAAAEMLCSFCQDSMAGKVPFHRYNYKYCSTTCMHAHKEIIEDD